MRSTHKLDVHIRKTLKNQSLETNEDYYHWFWSYADLIKLIKKWVFLYRHCLLDRHHNPYIYSGYKKKY